MTDLLIDLREDGSVSLWDRERGLQYLRVIGSDGIRRWVKRTPSGLREVSAHRGRRLDRAYRHRDGLERVRRYSRLTAEDVAFFRTANLIAEIEEEAIEWIGRGHDANIELGRRFIRLKDIVGHGHFEEYYERKFAQPYGIAFRTAQAYMQRARKAAEESKGADSALFPLAMDSQAVEVRQATNNHAAAIAKIDRRNSSEDSSDENTSSETREVRSDMCTCRPSIRMTRDQRQRVAALWKSEHRALAETTVTAFLMKLCDKCEYTASDSDEGEADA